MGDHAKCLKSVREAAAEIASAAQAITDGSHDPAKAAADFAKAAFGKDGSNAKQLSDIDRAWLIFALTQETDFSPDGPSPASDCAPPEGSVATSPQHRLVTTGDPNSAVSASRPPGEIGEVILYQSTSNPTDNGFWGATATGITPNGATWVKLG